MERDSDRQKQMEGHCSTGQGSQRAVVPMEEEEEGSVWEWCRKFKEGRVHDEGGHGRKSVATVGLVERVDQVVRGKRSFTISELLKNIQKLQDLLCTQF